MGRRGPKKTPTSVLRLRGSWRANAPDRRDEVNVPVEKPTMPRWLRGEGRKEWHRLVPQLLSLRTVTRLDRDILMVYCATYAEYVEALKLREQTTIMVKRADGAVVPNPILAVMGKLIEQLRRTGAELGLSPASRAGLKVSSRRPENPVSGLAKFQQKAENPTGKS